MHVVNVKETNSRLFGSITSIMPWGCLSNVGSGHHPHPNSRVVIEHSQNNLEGCPYWEFSKREHFVAMTESHWTKLSRATSMALMFHIQKLISLYLSYDAFGLDLLVSKLVFFVSSLIPY